VRCDRQRTDRSEQDGGTVRLGIGNQLVGDVATGARAVLHHHRVAEVVAELLGDQPRCRVRGATGREADQQVDRPLWRESFGVGRPRANRGAGGKGDERQQRLAAAHGPRPQFRRRGGSPLRVASPAYFKVIGSARHLACCTSTCASPPSPAGSPPSALDRIDRDWHC